jgi:hypothetical protein
MVGGGLNIKPWQVWAGLWIASDLVALAYALLRLLSGARF